MTTQPEALRLAEKMESYSLRSGYAWHCHKAAAELRRLHEANQAMLEALKWMVANDDTNEGDYPVDRLGGQSWNEYNAYWIDGLNKARAAITKGEQA